MNNLRMNLYHSSEGQRFRRDLIRLECTVGPCSFWRVKGNLFLALLSLEATCQLQCQ